MGVRAVCGVIVLGYSIPLRDSRRSSPTCCAIQPLTGLREVFVKLLTKFNLVLIVVFGLGLGLISYFADNFLLKDARQQVLDQARLMATSAQATLTYTDQEVSPVLEKTPQHNSDFLPQTIPFYAANTTFKRLRAASYKDYVMREAALNPTNLDDRATEWEVDLITYFRNNPGQTERDGTRDTPTGPVLYLRDSNRCRGWLPGLPQRGFAGSQGDDQALRPRTRIRLEGQRDRGRADRFGAHVGAHRDGRTRASATCSSAWERSSCSP